MEDQVYRKFRKETHDIILIQKTYRTFQFNKKQKELLLSRTLNYKNQPAALIRIRQNNFQSLINNKIKNILKEIIKIDSLDYYTIENFLETFDNQNFDHSKIHNNMKKKRIRMYPVSITNKGDSNEMNFYWGEWDLNGNMEGFGIKIFSNGGFYFGTFKKNKMDGIGIYVFPNKGNDFSTMKFIEKEDKDNIGKNSINANKGIYFRPPSNIPLYCILFYVVDEPPKGIVAVFLIRTYKGTQYN
mgnify:CR=1 FL=1